MASGSGEVAENTDPNGNPANQGRRNTARPEGHEGRGNEGRMPPTQSAPPPQPYGTMNGYHSDSYHSDEDSMDTYNHQDGHTNGEPAPIDFSVKRTNGGSDAEADRDYAEYRRKARDYEKWREASGGRDSVSSGGGSDRDVKASPEPQRRIRNGVPSPGVTRKHGGAAAEPALTRHAAPGALSGTLPGAMPGAGMPLAAGMMPGFPGIINPALMAAGGFPFMMDPRQLQQMQLPLKPIKDENGSKGGKGNAAKGAGGVAAADAISALPMGFYGMPGMMPFPGMDPAAMMAGNSEELLTQYRMCIMKAQESLKAQEKLVQQRKLNLRRSSESDAANSPSSSSGGSSAAPAVSSSSEHHRNLNASSPPDHNRVTTSSPTSTTTPSGASTATSPLGLPPPTTSMGTLLPPSTYPTFTASAATAVAASASGTTSQHSQRRKPRTLPDEKKDSQYWDRRRKNNAAAKRSRDVRRAKEDEIAIRAAFLEQENLKLRVEVAALKNETSKLRCMLYNS